MLFYHLPEPEAAQPKPAARAAAAGKPAWAAYLPEHSQLVYVRDLGAACLVVVLAAYITARIVSDPASVRRALRKKVGG